MSESRVSTAIGTRLAEDLTTLTTEDVGAELTIGQPPVVLQMQSHAFIPLERPEQLRQWEEDLRNFYGISLDASAIVGRACETCSCCSTDDCGILQQR